MKNIILILCTVLLSCGPSAEERLWMKLHHTDTIPTDAQLKDIPKPVPQEILTSDVPDSNIKPNNTYDANDFGLIPGIIVRWVPNSLPDDHPIGDNFPSVFIHIRNNEGITKIFKADQNIWTNLDTYDTLR